MQTFPLIGNYGVIEEDFEGDCAVRGYVVREICDDFSNFRAQYDLNTFLKEKNICGICGIDTREVTRILREEGVMNAMICAEPPQDFAEIRDYAVRGVVRQVSGTTREVFEPTGEAQYDVTLIDYGAKMNIIRSLRARGCRVTVVPSETKTEEILKEHPDGVVLSNGPGDPAENRECIAEIAKLIGKLPVFGICLGHQLAALALGGKTVKLKYGHRGANQPVKEVGGNRTHITSQNHGYAVVSESLEGIGKVSFINANDGGCEGMEYPGKQCFTVQFHPEACAGPYDTSYLFDRFLDIMGGKNHA